MVYRDTLMVFLNKYFAPYAEKAKRDQYGANGIQFEGKDEIRKIALGVSASLEFFQKAAKKEADCFIVHHGINFNTMNQRIDAVLKNRLAILFEKKITLIGYHFLLDQNPEIGNNALVIKKLGGDLIEPFSDEWGWIGEFKEKTAALDTVKQCEKIYDHEALKFLEGPKKIKRFAVVSGAGIPHSKDITELVDSKVELYLTGVAAEDTESFIKEAGLNFAAFGHYNTEKLGVKALGDVIKSQFYVDVDFIDVPNEL